MDDQHELQSLSAYTVDVIDDPEISKESYFLNYRGSTGFQTAFVRDITWEDRGDEGHIEVDLDCPEFVNDDVLYKDRSYDTLKITVLEGESVTDIVMFINKMMRLDDPPKWIVFSEPGGAFNG